GSRRGRRRLLGVFQRLLVVFVHRLRRSSELGVLRVDLRNFRRGRGVTGDFRLGVVVHGVILANGIRDRIRWPWPLPARSRRRLKGGIAISMSAAGAKWRLP